MAVVTSTRNPAVRAARRLARGGHDGHVLVEAPGPIAAALAAGALTTVYVTERSRTAHADVLEAATAAGVTIQPVADHVLEAMAATRGPQGLVGIARLETLAPEGALGSSHLAVVLVDAADPGNVGTVVRTADAAGAGAVVLAGDSVDPGNPKAVRAAAGSLFHLPVARGSWEDVAQAARRAGLELVACTHTATTAHSDADLTGPLVLVLGSEAHGLPDHVAAACDRAIAVPQRGSAESLSLPVAAGVVLFEAQRQRAMPH